MLGKFLGKEQKSALPKNQIEVVCPVCGAAQIEPRLVVTTHCKKCREHLRIVNGRVLASSHMNPVPSAVFPAMLDSHPVAGETKTAATPTADGEQAQLPAALMPSENVVNEDIPLGLGHMMGFKEEEEGPKPSKNPVRPKSNLPPRPTEPASTAQPPLSAGTFQKMKEQGYYRQQYFKDVECFDCRNKFKTGRSARSTNCPACGSLICLEDVDINVPSTTAIRTRGDVLIRKNGNVNTSEVRCRDLKVHGQICAEIECSGDLTMRTMGIVIGEIHCHQFVVERGSEIKFLNTIYAENVDIQARIEGNIECSGRVTIGAQGCVQGDVTARSVSIEPGGQLNGAMNILRTTTAKPAQKPLKSDTGGTGSGGGTSASTGDLRLPPAFAAIFKNNPGNNAGNSSSNSNSQPGNPE
ncbi:polymer-forming protein [Roseimicrobium gellanilyticum]|uniref:Polymer-forming protein n=2 Tax=Roseimicrobium gellanilyticum TaxID=748857 RepID=A0A366HCX0_9BACT|nr:polymer-forming protein [Roseimicrobium gellanilyticum]